MAISLDQISVHAGEVMFQIINMAIDTPHEMIVVELDAGGQEFVVDPATIRIDEAAIDGLGKVEGLKAGQSGDLTLLLEQGDYKLICNLKGHYAARMVVSFTVTAAQG